MVDCNTWSLAVFFVTSFTFALSCLTYRIFAVCSFKHVDQVAVLETAGGTAYRTREVAMIELCSLACKVGSTLDKRCQKGRHGSV